MGNMQGESSQVNVKIDAGIHERLAAFIDSTDAREMGYHSKAQFATEAVRELLERRLGRQQDLVRMVSEIHKAVVK